MRETKNDTIRGAVRRRYGQIAESGKSGCGCGPTCCGSTPNDLDELSRELGYATPEIASVPFGANMGLGCGNPQAIAGLKSGETVLDLGSGGGIDCFLASRQVGDTGRVIGVDMTPEMVSRAQNSAEAGGYRNVEFRLGEIENLPIADETVDVILSNCVINLSPDKPRVFRESYRVLKKGGRLAIADIVARAELPEDLRDNVTLYTACVGGASLISDIEGMLADAGFEEIRVASKDESASFIRDWAPGKSIEDYVISATIEARKPAGGAT